MPLIAARLALERRLSDDDDTEWMGNAWHLTVLDPTDGARSKSFSSGEYISRAVNNHARPNDLVVLLKLCCAIDGVSDHCEFQSIAEANGSEENFAT
jgi:hypothetical protein